MILKYYKIIRILIYTVFVASILISCEKLLEEEAYNSSVGSLSSTKEGIELLVNGCYVSTKMWYAKEFGYDFSEIGTDIYTYGQDSPAPAFFEYNETKQNSLYGRNTVLWVELYKGINACNTAIQALEDYDVEMSNDLREQRLSEVKFLRALYYWLIVETWGGVHLKTEPTITSSGKANRMPVDSFYNVIFRDLDYAYEHCRLNALNTLNTDYGRVNKQAVQAFRARMALTKASYIRKGMQSGDADHYYKMAYDDALSIINSGYYSLHNDYSELWEFFNNDNNPEVIWIINYSKNLESMMNVDHDEYNSYLIGEVKEWDEREGGHHGHLMWGMYYQGQGMARDMENGRPFRRYVPTLYFLDLFNEDIDERYYGSHQFVWYCNDVTGVLPLAWNTNIIDLASGNTIPIPDNIEDGDLMYGLGDTAKFLTKYDIPDEDLLLHGSFYLNKNNYYIVFDRDQLYDENSVPLNRQVFIPLSKFRDPDRAAADNDGSERGSRDAYVIRLAEMYLIAAEANVYGAQTEGEYTAYNLLEQLAIKRSFNGNGAELLESYDIFPTSTITDEFFLEERAREFCGEQLRWFDLKRLHTPEEFVTYIKERNPDAINIQPFHYIRAIPQIQLDALSPSERGDFPQNPGYN